MGLSGTDVLFLKSYQHMSAPKSGRTSLSLDLPEKLIHYKNRFSVFLLAPPARALLAAFWDLPPASLWPLASALPSVIYSVFAVASFSRISQCITQSPNSET